MKKINHVVPAILGTCLIFAAVTAQAGDMMKKNGMTEKEGMMETKTMEKKTMMKHEEMGNNSMDKKMMDDKMMKEGTMKDKMKKEM